MPQAHLLPQSSVLTVLRAGDSSQSFHIKLQISYLDYKHHYVMALLALQGWGPEMQYKPILSMLSQYLDFALQYAKVRVL
jgi:hypothetical protein